MTPRSCVMPAETNIVASQKAMQMLANELAKEILPHGQAFVREDGNLNHFAVFSWLHRAERDTGILHQATMETGGSIWLLACRLSETLQPSVDKIQQMNTLKRAVDDMTHVFLFKNLMSFWHTNDSIQEEEWPPQSLWEGETIVGGLKQ